MSSEEDDESDKLLASWLINSVTPRQWREASEEERTAMRTFWRRQGLISFGCLNCRYPLPFGAAWCRSCAPEKYDKEE